MTAFLHASLWCASFGSSWCSFIITLCTLSILLSLGLPRGLSPPTFVISFATILSSLLIAWPSHGGHFWVTLCGDWLDHCIAHELFVTSFRFLCCSALLYIYVAPNSHCHKIWNVLPVTARLLLSRCVVVVTNIILITLYSWFPVFSEVRCMILAWRLGSARNCRDLCPIPSSQHLITAPSDKRLQNVESQSVAVAVIHDSPRSLHFSSIHHYSVHIVVMAFLTFLCISGFLQGCFSVLFKHILKTEQVFPMCGRYMNKSMLESFTCIWCYQVYGSFHSNSTGVLLFAYMSYFLVQETWSSFLSIKYIPLGWAWLPEYCRTVRACLFFDHE